MKNTITIFLVGIFLLTTTAVSANNHNTNMHTGDMEKYQELNGVDAETKADIKELHDSMKIAIRELQESYEGDMTAEDKKEFMDQVQIMKSELHDQVIILLGDNTEAIEELEKRKEQMEAQHDTLVQHRSEEKEARDNLLAELDEETRDAFKLLQTEHHTALSELTSDYSDDMTEEEKIAIEDRYETLQKSHQEEVAILLADYPDILEHLKMHHDSREDGVNKGMHLKKIAEKQTPAKMHRTAMLNEKIAEKKGTYKKQFVKKYKTRLETASDEKLEKVLDKIETYITKYEGKDNISDLKKANIIAQLEALSEMIQNIIDQDDTLDIMEEILN